MIKESWGDRFFLTGIYLFLFVILIIVAYPLLYILSSSFSSPSAVTAGKVWLLPVEFSIDGYKAVFANRAVMVGYANSVFYTVAGTTINVILTVLLGYTLSRKTFYGRNVIMMMLVFTMIFEGGLIPFYLTVRELGLTGTRWALLIPNAMAVFQVIIARTFFMSTIPEELYDAALIDGSSDVNFLTRIVIPMSKPIIAVMILMYAVGHWNAYFHALIFLNSDDMMPLQIILRRILIMNQVEMASMDNVAAQARLDLSQMLKYSLIVVASGPILILYPFIQRYFVQGMLLGSLKG